MDWIVGTIVPGRVGEGGNSARDLVARIDSLVNMLSFNMSDFQNCSGDISLDLQKGLLTTAATTTASVRWNSSRIEFAHVLRSQPPPVGPWR